MHQAEVISMLTNLWNTGFPCSYKKAKSSKGAGSQTSAQYQRWGNVGKDTQQGEKKK